MLYKEAAHRWGHWETTLPRPTVEAQDVINSSGLVRPFTDPLLRRRQPCAEFCQELEHVPQTVGVKKTDGIPQQIIFDIRAANCHIHRPMHTQLPSAGSFADLEARPATCSQRDVAAASHSWGHFFALARVRAGDVGIQEVDGQPLDSSAWLSPLFTVLPMGWCWSVFFMQVALRAAGLRARLQDDDAIEERRAPRPMTKGTEQRHATYVDNFLCFGSTLPRKW